jgi:hypothetical protein
VKETEFNEFDLVVQPVTILTQRPKRIFSHLLLLKIAWSLVIYFLKHGV